MADFLSQFCHSANEIQRDLAVSEDRLCDCYFLC